MFFDGQSQTTYGTNRRDVCGLRSGTLSFGRHRLLACRLGLPGAVRFHWSQMSLLLQVVVGLLLLCSFYLFFLTFRENAYLSPAVRVQTEREQTVVSTGPYRYVRHPMYATALIFLGSTTLLLGSWYGLILGLLLFVGIALRAVQEERTLQAELPGYDKYMAQVKYRLIPYIW